MGEELFEVVFCGEIGEGRDLAEVRAKVGALFKADEARLAHLFSGKRVVIKKNIDQATAEKYKTALNRAGALCEIKSLSPTAEPVAAPVAEKTADSVTPEDEAEKMHRKVLERAFQHARDNPMNIPAAPQTAPLGISADDISELNADLAPVGSDVQDEIPQVEAPQLDISGLDVAPPGSDLGQLKKEETPPPPDTSGLSLTD